MSGDVVETHEISPVDLGWHPLGNRMWRQPGGALYKFAPGQRQVLVREGPAPTYTPRSILLRALQSKADQMGLVAEFNDMFGKWVDNK